MNIREVKYREIKQLDRIWKNLPERSKQIVDIGFIGNFTYKRYNLFHRIVLLLSTSSTYRKLSNFLGLEFFLTLVALNNKKIVGFTHTCINKLDNKRFKKDRGIFGIVIDKEYWNRGVGSALLEETIEKCRKLGLKHLILTVFEENRHAIKLYQNYQFTVTDKRENILEMSKRMII